MRPWFLPLSITLAMLGCQAQQPGSPATPTPLPRAAVPGNLHSQATRAENTQQSLAVGKAPRPKPSPKPALKPLPNRQTLTIGPPPPALARDPVSQIPAAIPQAITPQSSQENLLQVTTELSQDTLSTRRGQTLYALVEINPGPGHAAAGQTHLSLVMDVSGSMGSTGVGLASAAASQIFAQAGPKDHTWLVAFANEARILLEGKALRPGPDEIMGLLEGAAVGGGTQLEVGMEAALSAMQSVPPGPATRHMILVTDGVTNADSALQSCSRVAQAGISVSCVAIQNGNEILLQAIANLGQGHYYAITSPDQLPNILARDARSVRDIFLRDLQLSTQLAPGVRLRRAFIPNQARQLELQKSAGSNQMKLGHLRHNQTTRVLLELEVDPGQNPVQKLASMAVQARNPDQTPRAAQPLQDLSVPTFQGRPPRHNRFVRKWVERVFSTQKTP